MVSRESFPQSGNLKDSILKWAKFFGGTLAKLSLSLFHIRPGKLAIFLSIKSSMKGYHMLLGNASQESFFSRANLKDSILK